MRQELASGSKNRGIQDLHCRLAVVECPGDPVLRTFRIWKGTLYYTYTTFRLMIKKLDRNNVQQYFCNENIVMLVLSHDKYILDNINGEFYIPLVLFAKHITKDGPLSQEIAKASIEELCALVLQGMPITNFADDLYNLAWQKIVARLYSTDTKDHGQSLKDAFIRGHILAEVVREQVLYYPDRRRVWPFGAHMKVVKVSPVRQEQYKRYNT